MLFVTLGGGTLAVSTSSAKIHENHEQRIISLERQAEKTLKCIIDKLELIDWKLQHVNCKMDVK